MSLLTTSDTSMVKIMKCLDNKSDRKTLRNLRNCSYKDKKVADDNGFSKIPEAEVDIYFGEQVNSDYFYVSAHIRLYVQDEQDQYDEDEDDDDEYKEDDDEYEEDDDEDDDEDEEDELEKTNCIDFAQSDNHSKSMDEVLLYLQSKVKTIKRLEVVGANLDDDMLEVFRKHGNFIKTIDDMALNGVGRQEWNADQILQFMKLFDNLETFHFGAYFKESAAGIITNEMLSLVKTSATVWNMPYCMSTPDHQRNPFPHITSSIFDFWIEKNTIKDINFKGIITEIPLSSVRKMIEHLSNNPKHRTSLHFGTLKYSSDFYQQLALFQKEKEFKFSVSNYNGLCNVVITSEKSRQEFEFEAHLNDNAVL